MSATIAPFAVRPYESRADRTDHGYGPRPGSGGELGDVALVAGEDDRPVGERRDHDGGVDHIAGGCLPAQHPGGLRALEQRRLDLAGAQEPAEHNLAAAVSPRLAYDDSRNDDPAPVLQRQVMQRPHPAVVGVNSDEHTSVVHIRDVHAADPATPSSAAASAAAISARAAASSRGVNAPCSACHSAISARPASSRSSRSAALATRRETGT